LSGQHPETGKDGVSRWVDGNEEEVKVKINQLVKTMHGEHVQSLMRTGRYAEAEKFTREHMREFGDKANDTLLRIEAGKEAWAHTPTGELAKALGQFITGYAVGGVGLKGVKAATTAGRIIKGAAQGAIADFAFFDGQEERLSNLVQEFPALQNPINEFLAAKPGDGQMEGRFKNALEGLGLGAMTEAAILAFKSLRNARIAKAKAEQAGPEAVQKAVEEAATREAGLKSLGDTNAPLVQPLRVEDIVPAEPVKTTAHESGVTVIPRADRERRHAIMNSVDFNKAKNGDVEAAESVVDKVWTEKQTRELAAKLDPNKETVFISVPSTSGKNEIPNALAQKLAAELGGAPVDSRAIYKVNAAKPMKAVPVSERPFASRNYTLENPEALQGLAGKQVVIVEDIFTTGASVRQFIGALRKDGIDVSTVAGLMGDARLDAPMPLVNRLQSMLKEAGLNVKSRQLAQALSGGEIEVITKLVGKTRGPHERKELTKRIQGLLDSRTGDVLGRHEQPRAGGAEGVSGIRVGDARSSEGISSGTERLEPGQSGEKSGYGTGEEATRALRDRSGSMGGRGGEQVTDGGIDHFFINFSRIDAPEDVKTVMQNMADNYRGEIDAARRGVRTFEQTALSAEQEDAWKILAERRTGEPLNAEQSLAARNLWANSGQKLNELAELATQAPTEENLFAFRKMLEVHRAIQNEVIAARTETARTLGAWRIPSGPRELNLRQMKEVLDGTGGVESARDLAARVAKLSKSGMTQELETLVAKTPLQITRESLQEAWVMALLSGPKTHIVNTMSNATVALGEIFERAAAARIGAVLGDTEGVVAGEALSMLNGLVGGVKDGLRLAWKAFKTDQGGSWGGKIDLPHNPAISAENWGLAKEGAFGRFVDLLGNVVRLPGRALVAEDEFFKSIGYRAELNAQAYRQATREAAAGRIGKEQVRERMAELLENPPDNIHIAAVDHATYSTFTNTPGKFAQSWLGITRKFPAMRFIMPFVKTPANIFNYAVAQRSPFAPLFRSFREDMAAGGARRQLALARVGGGTTIMLATADLAFNGQITGGGPANPAEKQALMRTGWQPYSVKIGDRYFSYNRLDPVGSVMGIAADIADITTHMDHEDREVDADEAAVYFAATIAGNVLNKSYMRGMSEMVDVLANPTMRAESFAQRFAGSFVPTALAEAARQQDPYRLELNSLLDSMKSRIPGLSKNLPARRDLWGRAISYRSGLGSIYDAVSPIASRRENPEPIDLEMLKQETYVGGIKRQVMFDGVTVDLTRDEFKGAYSRYAQLAGNTLKHPAWGKGCMDYLNDVVTGKSPMSAAYDLRSDGPDGGKALFIRAAVAEYRELARKQLLEEYPELRRYVEGKKSSSPGTVRLTRAYSL
jgi:adenine/guanine phosphoribosyltransferase-like PRPP-binding protein